MTHTALHVLATRRLSMVPAALLVSSSMLAILAAGPVRAACDVNGTDSCDNDSSYGQHIDVNGAPGSGDNDGGDAPNFTLNNDISVSQSGDQNDGSDRQIGALFLLGTGGTGSYDTKNDATRAGDGGTQTINNTGSVSVNSVTLDRFDNVSDTDQPGIYDNGNLITGIFAAAVGGLGADANETVIGGGDGGRGGDGGFVTITNSGTVTLNSNFANGGVGIYGASIAGPGGDQDKAATGDQVGGNSGDAKEVTITNSGAVSVTSGNAAGDIWGIGAEGLGNNGGANAAASGAGALVTITNSANVTVNATGSGLTSLRGISARSQGGVGSASSDGSDQGGKGESAKEVTITQSGVINVTSYDLTAPTDGSEQSAGIVLISRGGDGGEGPQDIEVFDTQVAGQGGDGSTTDGVTIGESILTLQDGATIQTYGDYIAGIFAASEGGNGADGREDSAGGDGGTGGNLLVEINDSSSVHTNGANAPGVIARVAGGTGGGVLTSSGLVDTGASEAGDGGLSGNVTVWLGFTLDDANNDAVVQNGPARISTTGAGSTGVLAQAVGGGGGGVTSNFELFGQPASQSGGGGTGQSVFLEGFADVSTTGSASAGLTAQSIGGGGGVSEQDSGLIAVGGNGGAGANSAYTTVSFSGSVTTQGEESIGILAQGIGGGGGAAAGAEGVATIGGQGGGGGIGGDITVNLPDTDVTTSGDFSYGIVAQSVGGGGGDGGSVFDLSLLPLGDPIPVVGVGGNGAEGGAGDQVTLSNLAAFDQAADVVGALTVATAGSNAHGVVVQSIGGGGGSGGNAVGLSTFSPTSFQIAGAADGGGAGDVSTVTLDDFDIATTGSHAAGIVAQSIGGGGGTGGSASAKDVNLILSISASVGGVGGDGGDAGTTGLSLSNGQITTGGNDATDAFGIVAQAIGGGGGMAGSSISDSRALALEIDDIPPVGLSIDASIGGTGGTGGRGGPGVSGTDAVSVALNATSLQTGGDGSIGIIAQSIGGGGGTGGSASSTAGVTGGSDSIGGSLAFAVGNAGGSGGAGDMVQVSLDDSSSIETFGDYANGILAQSIGGGGGSGGPGAATTSDAASGFSLSATMSVGGQGSNGGSGGAVSIDLAQDSVLTTYGSGARAVVAQSIGGGGGASQGSAFGVSVAGSSGEGTEETEAEVSATLEVGVDGAGGGNAGALSVTGYGTVETSGGDADGYLLQSIGGGGGLAGSAGSDADEEDDSSGEGSRFGGGDESTSYSFDLALGARGGQSGDGGTIALDYRGQTTTYGDYADGLVVQSIGGGGGAGGTATADGSEASANINIAVGGQGGGGGYGGDLNIDLNGSNFDYVLTYGYGAYGILLQSIGGGGGQGADGSEFAHGFLRVSGGSGSSGGGGRVTVSDYIYRLSTSGDDAPGFVAQSIGGGGGVGLAGSSASAESDDSHSIDLVLGGSVGSQASDVSASLGATFFYTEGDRAYGLVAQSIAGGGGIASVGDKSGIASVAVGQSNYSSNRSGAVDVAWTSPGVDLSTSGAGSHAIIAQSISGGGGIVGDSSTGTYSTSIADQNAPSSGTAGAVTVEASGNITTSGTNAFGIIAQSLGGNGGLIGGPDGTTIGLYGPSNASAGGPVTITTNGSVEALGDGSVGLFAQSLGTAQGAIDVTVSNVVTGGSGTGQAAGIVVHGGTANNLLTVNSGGTVSAGSGTAVRFIQSDLGSDILTVQNAGQITGAVTGTANADQSAKLSRAAARTAPVVTINNAQTGVLSGADLYQADIVNAGQLVVGTRLDPAAGAGHPLNALRIDGNLTQSATGQLIMAADFASGASDNLHVTGDLTLGGTLEIEASTIMHGATTRLLSTDGAIAGAFSGLRSEIFQYDFSGTAQSLDVTVQGADFDQARFGLTQTQSDIANHLEAVFLAGDAGFGATFAALETAAKDGTEALAQSYTSLTSQASSVGAAMNFKQSRLRFNDLLSCDGFSSDGSFERGSDCFKVNAGGQAFDQSADGNALGYDGTIGSLGIGGQHVLDTGLILSGAIGYENSLFNYGGSDSRTEGDTVHVEAALTQSWNNFSLSFAVGASNGSFDITRNVDVSGQTATATGRYDATSIAGRLRAAYRRPTAQGQLRALFDIDVINARSDQYTETGAGSLNLAVDANDETAVVASPTLEYGQFFALGNGKRVKAYGSIGMSFSSLDSYGTQAQFADASAGSGSFLNEVAVSSISGNVTLGAQLLGVENMTAGVEYNGSFADGFAGHRASLNLRWLF